MHTGSAIRSLNALHQRSRSLIRHVSLSIPSHYDILDEFPDIVRLGLRYCWGLKTLVVHLPFVMPDESERSDIGAGNAGNVVGNGVGCGGRICGSGGSSSRRSSVFANAFHIIRWLPKQTVVRLEGIVPWDIADVVEGHMLENEVGESEGSGRERERVSDIHVLEPMFLN